MPVVLITDVLVWLLVLVTLGYAVYCRRHPHLMVPWARVFRSPAAMASLVVLVTYLAVGLLDSLHFRPALKAKEGEPAAYSTEVLSVLDLGLAGLRGRGEKTYSAPLDTHSYAREQIELPGGKVAREFPRLRYGGAHLKSEADWAPDVSRRVVLGFGSAAVAFVLLFLLARILKRKWPEVPWHAALMAFGVILFLAGPAIALSTGYHVLGTD